MISAANTIRYYCGIPGSLYMVIFTLWDRADYGLRSCQCLIRVDHAVSTYIHDLNYLHFRSKLQSGLLAFFEVL